TPSAAFEALRRLPRRPATAINAPQRTRLLALFIERSEKARGVFAGPNQIEPNDSLNLAAMISRECAGIVGVGKVHLCNMFPIPDGLIGSAYIEMALDSAL